MRTFFTAVALAASLTVFMLPFNAGADVGSAGFNWDRDLAMEASREIDAAAEADRLLRQVTGAGAAEAEQALADVASHPRWSDPAREAVLYRFTEKLRSLEPGSVDPAVLDFLLDYSNRVLVPHEETAAIGVPLFPIRAVAQGLVNQWTRERAAQDAARYLGWDPEYLVRIYSENEDFNIRAGIEAAIAGADADTLRPLLDLVLLLLESNPDLTGLAGKLALAMDDPEALLRVFSDGEGASLVDLGRLVAKLFTEEQVGKLFLDTLEKTPSATSAMLIAEWGPRVIDQAGVRQALEGKRNDPNLGSAAKLALSDRSILTSSEANKSSDSKTVHRLAAVEDDTIQEWTEADGLLGLGYPVPIPVDTPLPFDGFRSYSGLHARHQDLAATTDIVHGQVVGTTHNGRNIWAYRIGDADLLTRDGRPEPATLTNGGIHAREWQTPEVVTGIMELFAEKKGDHYFYDFLLDNVNMVLLPVQNVDGFLQTQRYPSQNWYGTDPFDAANDPQASPRDGRMRRKNMPGVDENLATKEDHLFGIDLNRNNPPYWNTNLNRSSPDNRSLVYHGASAHSEPEAQALVAAAALGPMSQLRAFTDVHSFSQYFYYHRTFNARLTSNTVDVIYTMQRHNATIPNGTTYTFNASLAQQPFGMTNEWLTESLEIPSWGIEVEPSSGQSGIPGNPPGCGADYGGLARNCHDGFILPESEIRRVRETLSQSFTAAFYQQAGPPSIAALRFVDAATDAVVYEAEWDPDGANGRTLYTNQVQPLQLGRDYTLWIAYDRPMRWRENGQVVQFPGQPSTSLNFSLEAYVGDDAVTTSQGDVQWVETPGDAPGGYFRYKNDTAAFNFSFPADSQINQGLITTSTPVTLHNATTNMTYQALDTDPSTTVSWLAGGWTGYENTDGEEGDTGGIDTNIQVLLSPDVQVDPFVIEPGISAAWFDPAHDGEGFLIEILPDGRAVVYWFTFDDNGEQAWYLAVGDVVGNRLIFPELVKTSGGIFGPDFDPETVERTVVGSATFLYESCSSGTMVYELPGRKGRFNLQRLSRVMGANCGLYLGPPERPEEIQSGSWYNPGQDGHGFVIEVLSDSQVLVYWFTYDLEGNQAWFLGIGGIEEGDLVIAEVFRTRGPLFGPDFNPADLELIPWGELRFSLSCETGSVTYDGTPAGFGADTIALERLSTLAGLSCGE